MKITEQVNQGEYTYQLEGRFDAHQVPQFKSTVEPVKGNLVLDFSGINFIDSTGIAILIKLYKHNKLENLGFRIINVQDQVRLIFEIAQLHTVLPIESS